MHSAASNFAREGELISELYLQWLCVLCVFWVPHREPCHHHASFTERIRSLNQHRFFKNENFLIMCSRYILIVCFCVLLFSCFKQICCVLSVC